VNNKPIAALLISTTMFTAAFAADVTSARSALMIPGPPNCEMSQETKNSLKQGGFDPANTTQYCYSELASVPGQIDQIIASKPSILVIYASAFVARAARDATSTLPIVFVDVADPVANGLAKSLSHPGLNMTGITNITDELVGKRVELLKEAFPQLSRLALLGNLTDEGQLAYSRVARDAAEKIHVETKLYEVESPKQLAPAFDAMARDQMQAVMLLPDAWFFPNRSEFVALTLSHHIPSIGGLEAYADLGQVLTYGANFADMNLRAQALIRKILNGAKPGDLPVERPTKYDFIVNAKTAREQGFKLPPAIMMRATRVIE